MRDLEFHKISQWFFNIYLPTYHLSFFFFENPSHNPVPLIAVVSCLKERDGKVRRR